MPLLSLPEAVDTYKALAHPARLRVLAMLRGGELCVCQLTAALGLAASTVSSHLAELRRAGFLDERKDGRWVFYRLRDDPWTTGLLASVWLSLTSDSLVKRDVSVIRTLRRISPDKLCRAGLNLQRLGIKPAPSRS